MKSYLDCIPCFLRQALEAARFATSNPTDQETILREVLAFSAKMNLNDSPPRVGQMIHRRLRELTGNEDPYLQVKQKFNNLALTMLEDLRGKIKKAPDSLELALRLAITGNVIDFGISANLTEEQARQEVEKTLQTPLNANIKQFKQSVNHSKKILYLADNAGEIVFDRLLIEQLPTKKITLAVRGNPVINDATIADAQTAGLDLLVEIIENGNDAPGTIIEDCSPQFQQKFHQADMIISKGQGNFETLSDSDHQNIFFLFKVKCPVVARHINAPLGSLQLYHNKEHS